MKAWISVDMEGVSGIVDREQLMPSARLYDTSRAWMMADLEAVLDGILQDSAVDCVVVNDSHDGMLNLPWNKFRRGVELISGGNKPGSMNAGVEEADFALYVGYHAMAGTQDAIMDHTYSGEIRQVRLNGMPVGETGINAAIAGHHGVPVILVSGDGAVAEEARALLPWVETAPVKWARSRRSARLLPPEEAYALIRAKTANALARYRQGEVKPWTVELPARLEVDLMTTDMADRAMFCPYMERVSATAVGQMFDSIAELFRGFYTVMALASGRPLY